MNIDGGDHQFKIGAEVNDLEVYNLFAVNATGTLFFANLDDFAKATSLPERPSSRLRTERLSPVTLDGGDINATPSGDINEAAATFTRTIYSVYRAG